MTLAIMISTVFAIGLLIMVFDIFPTRPMQSLQLEYIKID